MHARCVASNTRGRYYEAFPTLYRGNTFQFRGAPGLLAFNSSISTFNWHLLSHVQISNTWRNHWPWEDLESWEKCCEQLKELPSLQSLSLDMNIQHDEDLPTPRDADLVIHALQPLKDVKAKFFKVELNIEPSQDIWDRLGHVNFTVVVKKREQNTEVYGKWPELSIRDDH
jgi:hypothetical protein